ncbi:MAG: UvrB/UvrC motif-containing protein [Sedimentisphaerales bacterium]|nr:UvrB/UvrC motif-containing protein [Sedimentisphaerales bacterium]
MLCQSCKERTATIHLTEISGGQRSEMHICEQCAQEQGIVVKNQIPINELLSTLLSAQAEGQTGGAGTAGIDPSEELSCPVCGMTLKKFSKTRLLGCPNDYIAFDEPLRSLIERSQGGHSRHCGKTPSRAPSAMKNHMEMMNLRRQLEEAVKAEDYETAARIRDQMQQKL